MHSKKRDIWSELKQQVAFPFFLILKATQCHFNKAPVGMPDDRTKKRNAIFSARTIATLSRN